MEKPKQIVNNFPKSIEHDMVANGNGKNYLAKLMSWDLKRYDPYIYV